MSSSIVPQADIGALSLRGLSVFKTILAACSADDVDPTALLQLSTLGDSFFISGRYAAQVPDLLQRYSNVAIERLSISVGWRRGDAASFIATSAGGQAIALLCLCLYSMYPSPGADYILHTLSKKLLSRSDAISSRSQLSKVGRLLSRKLRPIGFGNILARQTYKIHDVFEQLGVKAPDDLLEQVSVECMSEILECVSVVLQGENRILRITGAQGLGHIAGLMLSMFPDDTLLTVNGLVVFEGPQRRIVIEIRSTLSENETTNFRMERELQPVENLKIPINISPRKGMVVGSPYTFHWKDWIADNLSLSLHSIGVPCTAELLSACCDILEYVPTLLGIRNGFSNSIHLTEVPKSVLHRIFDPSSERFHNCCCLLMGSKTRVPRRARNLQEATSWLVAISEDILSSVDCLCGRCNFSAGWNFDVHFCKRRFGWSAIGQSLDHAFGSYFATCAPSVGIRAPSRRGEKKGLLQILINFFLGSVEGNDLTRLGCEALFDYIRQSVIAKPPEGWNLVVSSGGVTLFPRILYQLVPSEDEAFTFDILDGQINLEGRYYQSVNSMPRSDNNLPMIDLKEHNIVPSSKGVHTRLLNTLRETSHDHLELYTTIRCEGEDVTIDLEGIIVASFALQRFQPCPHPVLDPLIETKGFKILATSTANPDLFTLWPARMVDLDIAVVQTRQNLTAQLLSCRQFKEMYLLKDCCLNCAVAHLSELPPVEELDIRKRPPKPTLIICS